ncbi:Hypothetical protein D9617_10g074800 [Elsinoe fawcettii]|nr:Hypothetical protein D9617_10g074800 [Elsinoe fawcettii]
MYPPHVRTAKDVGQRPLRRQSDNILAWQGTTYSRRACATTLGPRQTPLARQAYVTLSPSASLPTGVNNATISGLPIQPAEKDLSRGATIGIAIGVGIGVSLALGCCVGWWRRRHPKRSDSFARIPEKDPVEEDIQEVDQGTEQTIESWVDGVTDDDASDEIGTADVTSLRSSVPGQ